VRKRKRLLVQVAATLVLALVGFGAAGIVSGVGFAHDEPTTGSTGSSTNDTTDTTTTTPPGTTEPPPGGEGCTPGYWKSHLDSWGPTGYTPGQSLGSVFSVVGLGSLSSDSLLTALDYGGGSSLVDAKRILLRAAVAALLNAAHPDVDYAMSEAEIIADVNAQLTSGTRSSILALKDELDAANNAGCPID
jgi:hypothetical protein